MRRRMGAAALELDVSDGSSQDTLARHRRGSASQPALAAAAGAHRGCRCAHRGTGRVRPPQRNRSGGRRRRQHHGGPGLPHRREPLHQRRLSTQRERRPGGRIRAGTGAVTIRRQVAVCRWSGAWISQPRSTSCAQGAAESRPSFRTAARVTCSTPMRRIRRRVLRPREEATTKAEPSPSRSPRSGADAGEASRLGQGWRTTPAGGGSGAVRAGIQGDDGQHRRAPHACLGGVLDIELGSPSVVTRRRRPS